jgi:pimeloyl-ACP methyl ester carboxylesterase
MSPRIVFIHGMFLNPKCWEHWADYFSRRDFSCTAPAWPLHEGDPRRLRSIVPEGLGLLKLPDVIAKVAAEIRAGGTDQPIVIGHSVGGLVAQILAAQGLASLAVCLGSVAPHDLLAADWSLLKHIAAITNPAAGLSACELSVEDFYGTFCSSMTHAEAIEAFDELVVPDSRQVLRDSLRKAPHIDPAAPHVPFLFVAGGKDAVMPPGLVRKNAEYYTHPAGQTQFLEMPGRGHLLPFQAGWEEIADQVHQWILAQCDADITRRLDELADGESPQIRRYLIDE